MMMNICIFYVFYLSYAGIIKVKWITWSSIISDVLDFDQSEYFVDAQRCMFIFSFSHSKLLLSLLHKITNSSRNDFLP